VVRSPKLVKEQFALDTSLSPFVYVLCEGIYRAIFPKSRGNPLESAIIYYNCYRLPGFATVLTGH